MHFICPKILNIGAMLAIWNFDVRAILQQIKGRSLWGMVIVSILTDVLLFSPTSIFDFKGLTLNWSHVFHRTRNMRKLILVRHCTNKKLWEILAPSLFSQSNACVMFLKQLMKMRTPLCWKRPVRLSARNLCIKFYLCFCFLVIIRNAFEKWKNIKYIFGKERPK